MGGGEGHGHLFHSVQVRRVKVPGRSVPVVTGSAYPQLLSTLKQMIHLPDTSSVTQGLLKN